MATVQNTIKALVSDILEGKTNQCFVLALILTKEQIEERCFKIS